MGEVQSFLVGEISLKEAESMQKLEALIHLKLLFLPTSAQETEVLLSYKTSFWRNISTLNKSLVRFEGFTSVPKVDLIKTLWFTIKFAEIQINVVKTSQV